MCNLNSVKILQSFENLVNNQRCIGIGKRSIRLIDVRPKVPTCDQIFDDVSRKRQTCL